jgi:ComF family protein
MCGVEKGVDKYLCPVCAKDMEKHQAGASAAGAFAALSAYRYDGAAVKLVRRYKYGGDKWLGAFMADAIIESVDLSAVDIVCHVPLHDKRRKSRGFDQAEELAKRISQITGKPHIPALRRIRHTKTQTKLSAAQRQENMRGAFACTGRINGRVLLIDDVLTTGATTAECAAVLTAAGAEAVRVATFAQAVLGRQVIGAADIRSRA